MLAADTTTWPPYSISAPPIQYSRRPARTPIPPLYSITRGRCLVLDISNSQQHRSLIQSSSTTFQIEQYPTTTPLLVRAANKYDFSGWPSSSKNIPRVHGCVKDWLFMSTKKSRLSSPTIRTTSQQLLIILSEPIFVSSFRVLWPTLRLVVLHKAVGVPPGRRPCIV